MALIKCPECGRQVSDRAIECPGCGYPIHDNIKESVSDETKGIEQNPVKSDNSGNSKNDIDDRAGGVTDELEKPIANEEPYKNEGSFDTVTDDINFNDAAEESNINENIDDRKNRKRFIIISSVALGVIALALVFVFVILPSLAGLVKW